jgi:hypothetical protein
MVHALLFQGYGRTGCNGAQAVNSNNAGGGQRAGDNDRRAFQILHAAASRLELCRGDRPVIQARQASHDTAGAHPIDLIRKIVILR